MQYLNRFLQILLAPLRLLLGFFGRVIPGLKSVSRLSTPMLASVLTFIFLVTIQITFLIVAASMKESAQFGNFMSKLWISIPLIIVTPFVVYFFVRLLLAGESSRFPDLDVSWQAGLKSLRDHGIDIQETPVFLVLGVRDSLHPTRLMKASGRQFDVENVYGDSPSLQWYANEDEIYLFSRRAGTLSLLSQKFEKNTGVEAGNDFGLATILPGEMEQPEGEKHQAAFDVTALPGQLDSLDTGQPIGTGTLDASASKLIAAGAKNPKSPGKSEKKEARLTLSNRDLQEYEERLLHLCALLKKERSPVCPINGIVTTMGISLVESHADSVADHVNSDLALVQQELQIICPVTNIVTDLESDPGGVELAKRLGNQYKDRRFGKGNRVWNEPTREQMRSLSVHVGGAFELWIHKLFGDPESLKSNEVFGNRLLYRLLCRNAITIGPGIETILTNGFGTGKSEDPEDAMRLSGCYFSGIGTTEESCFFVKGIFDRVVDNAGEIEWTNAVHEQEEFLGLVSNLALATGMLSIIALLVLIFRGE